MPHDANRRNDPTRQTPLELQIYRLVQQIGTEMDVTDPRIAKAMKALVQAGDAISDYVDYVDNVVTGPAKP